MSDIYLIQNNYIQFDEDGISEWVTSIDVDQGAFTDPEQAAHRAETLSRSVWHRAYFRYAEDVRIRRGWVAEQYKLLEQGLHTGDARIVDHAWRLVFRVEQASIELMELDTFKDTTWVKDQFYDVVTVPLHPTQS